MSLSRAQQARVLTEITTNPLQIAIYTNDPTSSDVGTEVTLGGYLRQALVWNAPAVVGSGTEITNSNVISFPIAAADWELATHFGVRDTVTLGLVSYGTLTSLGVPTPRQIRAGDTFMLNAGAVKIRIPD